MSNITIERVNTKLLDEQRKTLATIPRDNLTQNQREALDGIQNMLDHWSDTNEE